MPVYILTSLYNFYMLLPLYNCFVNSEYSICIWENNVLCFHFERCRQNLKKLELLCWPTFSP